MSNMTKYKVEAVGTDKDSYKHVSDTPRKDHAIEDARLYSARTFAATVVTNTETGRVVATVKGGKVRKF